MSRRALHNFVLRCRNQKPLRRNFAQTSQVGGAAHFFSVDRFWDKNLSLVANVF